MRVENAPGKANVVPNALSRRPDLAVVVVECDELDGFL